MVQAIGGAALLGGLWFTARNLQVSQQNLQLAIEKQTEEHASAISARQLDTERQVTERFTRAIDQLGSTDVAGNPRLEIRLGAIYALERISTDSPRDQAAVVEILAAYIRTNAPCKDRATRPERDVADRFGPPEDIQAAATVIGRRDALADSDYISLVRTELREVEWAGADLRNVSLIGAHLDGAILSSADLRDSALTEVDLEGAELDDANLEGAALSLASLATAHLQRANLRAADLYLVDLREANLTGARVSNANLDRVGLESADLTAVRGLTLGQIDKASWNAATVWPSGFVPPEPTRLPISEQDYWATWSEDDWRDRQRRRSKGRRRRLVQEERPTPPITNAVR